MLSLEGELLGHQVDAPARHDGPQVLLCTEGSAQVHAKSSVLTLERGAAAWVAADDGPIRLISRAADQAVPCHGWHLRKGTMSSGGSKRAIIAALLANAGIALAKFVGFLITGSSSMLAEAVHSVADTSNQGLLLWGQRQAGKAPDALHQFGYGRSRYFYSFVVALVLFSLGAAFALYEGYEKIVHPHALTSPYVAIAILVVAIGLEGYSFRTAMVESQPLKGSGSWWRFIRTSRNPELPVVLLEDTGALIGLVFALAGVGLDDGDGQPDLGRHRHALHRRPPCGDRRHPDGRDAQRAHR